MTNNTTIVRVLENNLKPATHFIEVWGDGGCTNQEVGVEFIFPIKKLEKVLLVTRSNKSRTIAIFKIRMKPH